MRPRSSTFSGTRTPRHARRGLTASASTSSRVVRAVAVLRETSRRASSPYLGTILGSRSSSASRRIRIAPFGSTGSACVGPTGRSTSASTPGTTRLAPRIWAQALAHEAAARLGAPVDAMWRGARRQLTVKGQLACRPRASRRADATRFAYVFVERRADATRFACVFVETYRLLTEL